MGLSLPVSSLEKKMPKPRHHGGNQADDHNDDQRHPAACGDSGHQCLNRCGTGRGDGRDGVRSCLCSSGEGFGCRFCDLRRGAGRLAEVCAAAFVAFAVASAVLIAALEVCWAVFALFWAVLTVHLAVFTVARPVDFAVCFTVRCRISAALIVRLRA